MSNADRDNTPVSGSSCCRVHAVAENVLTSVVANGVAAVVVSLAGFLWYRLVAPDARSAVLIGVVLWIAWVTTATYLVLARRGRQTPGRTMPESETRFATGGEVDPAQGSKPICCALLESGFLSVYGQARETIVSSVTEVEKSFDFLGVSAQFPMELQDPSDGSYVFRKTMIRKVAQGARFRFLLLDPEAKEWVAAHASRESDGPHASDPGALKHRLSLHLKELRKLQDEAVKNNAEGAIDIKLYRDLPSLRLIIVDKRKVYVSLYGGRHLGVDGPQFVFANIDRSFFTGCSAFFEHVWTHPERKR